MVNIEELQQYIENIPYGQGLQLRVLSIDDGCAELSMAFSPRDDYGGVFYRGTLTTLADLAFCLAQATITGLNLNKSASASMKTSFMGHSISGTVIAKAQIFIKSDDLICGEVQIESEDGSLLSQSTLITASDT